MIQYAQAPTAILRNSALSTDARLLWCILLSYADRDGTRCHPGTAALSEHMGRDRKAVFRYLKELQSAGLIKRASGRKSASFATNSYHVLGTIEGAPPCPQIVHSPCPQIGNTTHIHVPRARKTRRERVGLKVGCMSPMAP